MANPEHLAILKQGVEKWNKWREEHPERALRGRIASRWIFAERICARRTSDGASLGGGPEPLTSAGRTSSAVEPAATCGNLSGGVPQWGGSHEASLSEANLERGKAQRSRPQRTLAGRTSRAEFPRADLSGLTSSGRTSAGRTLARLILVARSYRYEFGGANLSGADFTECTGRSTVLC